MFLFPTFFICVLISFFTVNVLYLLLNAINFFISNLFFFKFDDSVRVEICSPAVTFYVLYLFCCV